MSLAVVILSKTLTNFLPCATAIRRHEPLIPIILIDDGHLSPHVNGTADAMVQGIKPFVFARNANIGIELAFKLADCTGAILCNDDAILETPAGFSKLALAASERPDYGIISATTNLAGNARQFPSLGGSQRRALLRGHPPLQRVDLLRHEPDTLAFVCIYIPRITWDRVGPLDERFITYGWEDNDYCRRVKVAGLKLGIYDGCFVDHKRLPSSFRGHGITPDLSKGKAIYLKKWGSM